MTNNNETNDDELLEHVDRTGWPPGPWMDEPDKVQFKTKTGLPGLVVRNRIGALCGYVGVSKVHPLHGKGYGEIEMSIDVHGGLTYSAACYGHICHVPEPGEPDDVWWFGFDTSHSGDWSPNLNYAPYLPEDLKRMPGEFLEYRDLAYVKSEIEKLAEQLAARG